MNQRKLNSNERKIANLLQLSLVFLAFFFLSGCGRFLPEPQEMGTMALLRSFALDIGEEDQVRVTLSTGEQAKGLQGVLESPQVYQAYSSSIVGACHKIDSSSQDFIFYGYVDQLLIGDALAREGILPVLSHFAKTPGLSLGTGIWLCQEDASQILEAPQGEGTQAKLAAITQESQIGQAGITRKAGEVLSDIKEDGASYLPCVALSSDHILGEVGYGIFKNDQLVAQFQGELARGLELFQGHPQLLELELEGETYALSLSQIELVALPYFRGEELVQVVFQLDFVVDFLEFSQFPKANQQSALLSAVEDLVTQRCNLVLERLQELGCDPLALGGEVALSAPSHSWLLASTWQERFPDLSCATQVRGSLGSLLQY